MNRWLIAALIVGGLYLYSKSAAAATPGPALKSYTVWLNGQRVQGTLRPDGTVRSANAILGQLQTDGTILWAPGVLALPIA